MTQSSRQERLEEDGTLAQKGVCSDRQAMNECEHRMITMGLSGTSWSAKNKMGRLACVGIWRSMDSNRCY
ncbi:hypothetical protein RB195_003389 [Necator americanus]|uniref:Uncharacterized protein n=1 Tax=Necator americanus TaxID=51031 RepID=A0ABR1DNC6_NECAM